MHSQQIIKIRPFNDNDLETVIHLVDDFQNYISATDKKSNCTPFQSQKEAEIYLRQLLDDVTRQEGRFFVAEDNDQIVGFIQGIIDRHTDDTLHLLSHKPGAHGWIGELYVRQEYRGQGIAKSLIDKIREHFSSNGCVSMRLSVLADNVTARQVYEKIGFETRDLELAIDL